MANKIDYELLQRIARRAFVQMVTMIHVANNRDNQLPGDPKVGGHPAACSSCLELLAAIHLVTRGPEDYVCCKPHASPTDHALHNLLGLFRAKDGSWLSEQDAEKAMFGLRDFSDDGQPVFQSYHAEADPDNFHFLPSGSVGIPPVAAVYLSLAHRYAASHGWEVPKPWFWCMMGDSEFREGSLMEVLPEVSEREIGNVTWIVDYNRQNLDGTRIPNKRGLQGTDADRIQKTCEANGWRVIQVRHGSYRLKVFKKPGGKALQQVLEHGFTDYHFQMMLSVALVAVFVILPRTVDDPATDVNHEPPAESIASPEANPTATIESSPTTAKDEGLRRIVTEALDEGRSALQAGNPEAAAAAFRRASVLDPGNTAAEEGMRRAEFLAELQVLEAEALAHERRGNHVAAEAAAGRALELDPSSATARAVRDRIARRAEEDAYDDLVTRGLVALEDQNYRAALGAFSAAAEMRPGAPELADGLARARAGVRRQTVSAHLSHATEAEGTENWSAAVDAYRSALALEPTLAAARDGLVRSGRRLELSRRMIFHLENPSRLATTEVLDEAADLANEARAVTPRGPRFSELISRLDSLISHASTPVTVVLESDGLTEVMLHRVGRLGTFDSHTVDLRPGTYTVIGRRTGYQDVRLTIEVGPGEPPPKIVIRCTQRI